MTETTPLHGTDLPAPEPVYVNVRYLNQRDDKVYAYMLPPFLNVEKHDVVIVQTRDTLSLARIINFHGAPEYATKYVVQKVDLDKFEEWLQSVVPF